MTSQCSSKKLNCCMLLRHVRVLLLLQQFNVQHHHQVRNTQALWIDIIAIQKGKSNHGNKLYHAHIWKTTMETNFTMQISVERAVAKILRWIIPNLNLSLVFSPSMTCFPVFIFSFVNFMLLFFNLSYFGRALGRLF